VDSNGLLFAGLKTNTAFDTFCLVYDMGFFFFAADGSGTTFPYTEFAAVAELRIDFIVEKNLAHAGVTFGVFYMTIKFILKISQGGLYRVWGCLP